MLALVLVLAAAPVQARVRLAYDAAGTHCPSRERLASAVTARLGSDPFSEDALETVEVEVRRSQDSLSAKVIRSSPEGETGRRELTSPTTDCSELFRALELAVAIAIDPRAGLVRPAAQAAPPPPVSPPPPPAPVEAPNPTFVQLGLGPLGALGTGPTPAFGFIAMGGLRHRLFEVDLGGRVELPSTLGLSPGSLSTQSVVGNLSVCLAVSILRACALGEVGALRVTSTGLTPPAQQTVLLADLGARIALHLPFSDHLAVRPFFDLAASVTRTSVVVDGRPVWVTSPVVGVLGAALLFTSGR